MSLAKRESKPWTAIGIDNGSRLVAVTVPGGELTRATIHPVKLAEHDPAKKCLNAWDFAHDLVSGEVMEGKPVHVFIEAPFISPRTASAVIPLAQIQGAVMAGALAGGATGVYVVRPSQWKLKLFGQGNGNADKTYILEWMRTHWPWLHQWVIATLPKTIQQDAIDAGGVARYGVEVLIQSERI